MRNRAGARLTADGEHFLGYASQLVQTWDAARRDLPLPDGFRNLLNLGGEVSLCNPLLLNWMRRLREAIPGHAVRVEIGQGADCSSNWSRARWTPRWSTSRNTGRGCRSSSCWRKSW